MEIKALIGYFDLDPNRAVSLVLLAFAAQPGRRAYLQLFELFTNTATEQTLGFLFQHHAGPGGETPENLFAVAVTLIQVSVRCGALNPKPQAARPIHWRACHPCGRLCLAQPTGLRARCTVEGSVRAAAWRWRHGANGGGARRRAWCGWRR